MAARPGEDDGTLKRLRDVLKRLRDTAPLVDSDPDAFRTGVDEIASRLRDATGTAGEIELNISTNRISYGEDEVFKSEARTNNLAFDIFRQGLRRLTFKPGLTDDEVHAFVVAFAENRSADQIDEDFVSTLWRESMPNIAYLAIDGFTEKIFMSEERFLGAFRGVIDDVMPGLVGMVDEDPGDDGDRARTTVDDAQAADTADLEQRKLRKALPALTDGVIGAIRAEGELIPCTERTLELLARVALKHPSPLADDDLHRVLVRLLAAWLEDSAWQVFADGLRSLRGLVEDAGRFPPPVAERLQGLWQTIAGRDLAEQVAHHIDPEQTDFTAWARWHFASAKALAAPDLLELIDACQSPAGVAWLKDLLRRQGTESLDPWAERLRDPNPGVVLEVIEVIVGSDLQAQARPLLMDTMKHPAPEVRAAAAEGLAGAYDIAVREALLPFLKDPSPVVRRAVVTRFLAAGDRSVSPYLASTIKSDMFPGFDEDEQRLYFETLARLGGARFLEVFEQSLGLEEESGDLLSRFFKRGSSALIDTPTRRGAVSGLGILGSREAVALIRRVHGRADLGLAAHCDVVLRLAARGEAAGEAPEDIAPQKAKPLEDVGVGQGLLGARILFESARLATPGPQPPRPAGAPADDTPQAAEPGPSAPPSSLPSDITPTAPPMGAASEAPAAAPPPDAPLTAPPPLGDRPLLNATERYLPTDEMALEIDAEAFDGPLTLFDVSARLTGVEQAAARRRPPSRAPQVPDRIVERKAPRRPKHVDVTDYGDMSHKPGARLDDLLAEYLGQAVESADGGAKAAGPGPAGRPITPPAPPPPATPSSADAIRELLDLDATTHHEIEAISSGGPDASVLSETDPSIVPHSADDERQSVEALLKDFLALDAPTETASLDGDRPDDSFSAAIDRAPPLDDVAPDDPPALLELPASAIIGPADPAAAAREEDEAIELDEDDFEMIEDDFEIVDDEVEIEVEAAVEAAAEAGTPAEAAPEPEPAPEPDPVLEPEPEPEPEAAPEPAEAPVHAAPAAPDDAAPTGDTNKAVEDLLRDFLAFDPEG